VASWIVKCLSGARGALLNNYILLQFLAEDRARQATVSSFTSRHGWAPCDGVAQISGMGLQCAEFGERDCLAKSPSPIYHPGTKRTQKCSLLGGRLTGQSWFVNFSKSRPNMALPLVPIEWGSRHSRVPFALACIRDKIQAKSAAA
jgi:hypothetical protein